MSAWNMASRSLRRRRARTALTVSGIIVGVAMILVLLSLAAGTSTQTSQLIRTLGGADITVVNSTIPSGGAGAPVRADLRAIFGPTNKLNQSLVSTIEGINGVYAVSPQFATTGYLDQKSVFLYGIDPATYAAVTGGLNIVNGSTLESTQTDGIVLGSTLAQLLNVTVGSTVSVGSNASTATNYTVVGIFETGITFLERSGYIPLSNAQNMSGNEGLVTQIFVKASNPDIVNQLASEISSSIPGIRTVAPSTIIQSATQLTDTLSTFFTVIGLVALLAGAFGVMNTMIMSITERTREIGTLKAIGARKGQILKIFMSESFLIGLIGATVGCLIGSIVVFALPLFTGGLRTGGTGVLFRAALAPVITPYNLVLSFSLGILVGVLAGVYPAWRASRMNPVEALRHV